MNLLKYAVCVAFFGLFLTGLTLDHAHAALSVEPVSTTLHGSAAARPADLTFAIEQPATSLALPQVVLANATALGPWSDALPHAFGAEALAGPSSTLKVNAAIAVLGFIWLTLMWRRVQNQVVARRRVPAGR